MVFPAHAAELVIVNQLGDRRMRAANRALRVLSQFQLPKLEVKRVEQKQAADQRLPLADDELDGLERLNAANDTRQDTQHAALGAARHQARRRRLRVKAAVARPFPRIED